MRYLRITLLLLTAVAALASCSQMNRLLKSKDTEKIYQAGIDAYRHKKYRQAADYFEAVV